MFIRYLGVLFCWAIVTGLSPAHYHMLLPTSHSVKKGQPVTFTFQFGHPFEHELFSVEKTPKIWVFAPGSDKPLLIENLEKSELAGSEGKKVTAYKFSFTPEERGDYLVLAECAPVWMEEDKEYLEDTIKVVLHVQAQKGWDAQGHQNFEILPLTRPYGLQAGEVFQVEVNPPSKEPRRSPPERLTVEVERYNPEPPEVLPPDEQITRVVKTDRNGVATTTLPTSGWWAITAIRPAGTRSREGKDVPVRQRSTLWVYVDPRPGK